MHRLAYAVNVESEGSYKPAIRVEGKISALKSATVTEVLRAQADTGSDIGIRYIK